MVGVVPPPVLSAFVVIIKDPLKSLEIFMKHLLLELNALRCISFDTQLFLIIESLSFCRILGKQGNQFGHEDEIRLTILVNDLLLNLDFGLDFS
jgi:hypothetical protein